MATTTIEAARTRRGWTTRDAVLVAVLAVVFGFLYIQFVPIWIAAAGLGAQIGQEAVFGFWLIAGVLASYITRRPGAALVGEFLAALAEVLFGAAAGTPLLVTGLMQGLGAEIVFGARGWRNYSLTTVMLAVLSLAACTGTATAASQPPNPNASCVAFHSTEDAHSAPGTVGEEISSFATLGPGIVGGFASETSKVHGDSPEGCPPE